MTDSLNISPVSLLIKNSNKNIILLSDNNISSLKINLNNEKTEKFNIINSELIKLIREALDLGEEIIDNEEQATNIWLIFNWNRLITDFFLKTQLKTDDVDEILEKYQPEIPYVLDDHSLIKINEQYEKRISIFNDKVKQLTEIRKQIQKFLKKNGVTCNLNKVLTDLSKEVGEVIKRCGLDNFMPLDFKDREEGRREVDEDDIQVFLKLIFEQKKKQSIRLELWRNLRRQILRRDTLECVIKNDLCSDIFLNKYRESIKEIKTKIEAISFFFTEDVKQQIIRTYGIRLLILLLDAGFVSDSIREAFHDVEISDLNESDFDYSNLNSLSSVEVIDNMQNEDQIYNNIIKEDEIEEEKEEGVFLIN